MIKYLLEAYPKLKPEQYVKVMKIIKQYVNYKFHTLSVVDRENMLDKVVDDAFDEMFNKKINPENMEEAELRGFLKSAIDFSANDYYHYKVKIAIPKTLSYARFKEMAVRMNDLEKGFVRSLYKRNKLKELFVLKTEISTDARNQYIEILKKYNFMQDIDASKLATTYDPLKTTETDDNEQHYELPSSENPEEDVQEIVAKEAYIEALEELGFNEREIKFFNLLLAHDMSIHGVASYLTKRGNKPLLKALMPEGSTLSFVNIRMYLTRLEKKIVDALKANKELLQQKGLI